MKTRSNLLWIAALSCLATPLTGRAENAPLITTFTNPAPVGGGAFGARVAALGNDRVLIGAVNSLTVYLFGTNGTMLATFANPSPLDGRTFGQSLAVLDQDGVLVGAPMPMPPPEPEPRPEDWKAGVVYLFATNGTLLATLEHPNPVPGEYDSFAHALATAGNDRVLIGAPGTDIGGFGAGTAYLLNTNGTLLTTFACPTPAADDYFGLAVAALGNDRVLIGAPYRDAGALNAGAAYLFNTDGALLTTFSNPTPADDDHFGTTVASLGTDRVLIGAPGADLGAHDAGAVYLFSTSGTLLTVFINPTPEYFDSFGLAVSAVANDRVIIGAPYDNTGGSRAGAAYLFSADGALVVTYTAPAPKSWATFGSAVAAVGSYRVLLGGEQAGSAYLFSAPSLIYWRGGAGNWSDAAKWSPSPPKPASHVIVPIGSSVQVDIPDAETGGLTVQAGGALTVQPGAALVLNGPAMNNGSLTLSGDVISYAGGNAFVQNGTLTIKKGYAMKGFDAGGSDFSFVQASGTTTIEGTLDWGHGIIRVQGGRLDVQRESAMKGFDAGGRDLAYVQTGGAVTIDGTFETTNAGLEGGEMNGGGTLAGNLINDGGVLSPGASPGTFTITGNYLQTNTGTLRIEVAGRDAGQCDQLHVGGAVQLGGNLTVTLLDSFAPDLGEQFPFLSTTNLSGTFSNLAVPRGISLSYTNTGVVPVVTGIVPTDILGPVRTGGDAVFTFGTVTNRSYTVESAADLTATNWFFHTNLIGTGAKLRVTVPSTNAPRRFFRVAQP